MEKYLSPMGTFNKVQNRKYTVEVIESSEEPKNTGVIWKNNDSLRTHTEDGWDKPFKMKEGMKYAYWDEESIDAVGGWEAIKDFNDFSYMFAGTTGFSINEGASLDEIDDYLLNYVGKLNIMKTTKFHPTTMAHMFDGAKRNFIILPAMDTSNLKDVSHMLDNTNAEILPFVLIFMDTMESIFTGNDTAAMQNAMIEWYDMLYQFYIRTEESDKLFKKYGGFGKAMTKIRSGEIKESEMSSESIGLLKKINSMEEAIKIDLSNVTKCDNFIEKAARLGDTMFKNLGKSIDTLDGSNVQSGYEKRFTSDCANMLADRKEMTPGTIKMCAESKKYLDEYTSIASKYTDKNWTIV